MSPRARVGFIVYSTSPRDGGILPLQDAALLSYPDRLLLLLLNDGRAGCMLKPESVPSKAIFLCAYLFSSSLLCLDVRRMLFESKAPEATKLPVVGSRKLFCEDLLEIVVDGCCMEKYEELTELGSGNV